MFVHNRLPKHLRPRREKLFGDGRPRPLDRNAKARVMVYARQFTHVSQSHFLLVYKRQEIVRRCEGAHSTPI